MEKKYEIIFKIDGKNKVDFFVSEDSYIYLLDYLENKQAENIKKYE